MAEVVEIQGLDELRRRLRDPELVRQALRVFGSRAARTGKRTAIKAIDGGTGLAAQSIVAKAVPREGVIFVKSMMRLERALSIEQGRPSGDPPTLAGMIRWKEAVGHPESARKVREEIARRGAPGKRFLGQVGERWEASIPRWLQEAGDRILKRLKKGQ